jgi:hypothetical protein
LAWHGKVDVVYLSMWRFVLGHSGGVSSCDWRLEAVFILSYYKCICFSELYIPSSDFDNVSENSRSLVTLSRESLSKCQGRRYGCSTQGGAYTRGALPLKATWIGKLS